MTQDIAIAVLAGGKSRRMGRDKANIELDGATLLERISYVASIVAPTAVVGRDRPAGFQFDRVPFLPDDSPGLGPIGGLRTALAHFDSPVALIGCDMPLMQPDALGWLCEAFNESKAAHGLVTLRDGRVEPLFTVYRPACIPIIDDMLADGRRALRHLIENGSFDRVEASPDVATCLVNVNTPGELEELEQRL